VGMEGLRLSGPGAAAVGKPNARPPLLPLPKPSPCSCCCSDQAVYKAGLPCVPLLVLVLVSGLVVAALLAGVDSGDSAGPAGEPALLLAPLPVALRCCTSKLARCCACCSRAWMRRHSCISSSSSAPS